MIDQRFWGNVEKLLRETVLDRATRCRPAGGIYGEKNVTLAPFVRELYRLINCRFVFVKRFGPDVVASLLNWHNELFGSVYRECEDPGDLSDRAYAAVSALPIEEDSSDYSRPRPSAGDIWDDRWDRLSRLEMCSWYWSRINDLYRDQLEALPSEQWLEIDYTNPSSEAIGRVADFLGLRGLEADGIQAMLSGRINSLEDRIGQGGRFPKWSQWKAGDRARFEAIATKTMQRLGYYPSGHVRYRPPNYGEWWKSNKGGLEWYTWMYNARRAAHEDLLKFVQGVDACFGRTCSVLDVGCGLGVGYTEAFDARRYVGMDLSDKEIQWCRKHRVNPRHDFVCGDVIVDLPAEKFDVVFSQGTIDNSYDMNAYLRGLVSRSSGWIYVTAYRGWFPELSEHRYMWEETTTCFYNDISPAEARETLERLGCTDIRIEPLRMNSSEIPFETRIVARVPAGVLC